MESARSFLLLFSRPFFSFLLWELESVFSFFFLFLFSFPGFRFLRGFNAAMRECDVAHCTWALHTALYTLQ